MDNVTVPVPSERTAQFFAVYAAWLAEIPPATNTDAWDATQNGEFDIAARLWKNLNADQRNVIDAAAASGTIEAQQLAQALKLPGSITVTQLAHSINAVAHGVGRQDVLQISVQLEAVFIKLNPAAAAALLGHPDAKPGPPPPPPSPTRT